MSVRRRRPPARVVALALAAASLTGCYDVHTVDPGHPVVPLDADGTGWVASEGNPFGLAGVWYAYGDQYPTVERCTKTGLHPPDEGEHADTECSFIAWPDAWQPAKPAGEGNYPSSDNRFCTYGNTAKVNACQPGAERWCDASTPDRDYANMWGAGIGFKFHLDDDSKASDVPPSQGWNAPAHGIIGVTFDLEWTDPSVQEAPFMRIEFPVVLPPEGLVLEADTVDADGNLVEARDGLDEGATSDVHPSGSPFLNAPTKWGSSSSDLSHVNVGHNQVLWSQVPGAPSKFEDNYAYLFHPENLLGFQFHVPAIKETRIPYGFCVSNLALVRN